MTTTPPYYWMGDDTLSEASTPRGHGSPLALSRRTTGALAGATNAMPAQSASRFARCHSETSLNNRSAKPISPAVPAVDLRSMGPIWSVEPLGARSVGFPRPLGFDTFNPKFDHVTQSPRGVSLTHSSYSLPYSLSRVPPSCSLPVVTSPRRGSPTHSPRGVASHGVSPTRSPRCVTHLPRPISPPPAVRTMNLKSADDIGQSKRYYSQGESIVAATKTTCQFQACQVYDLNGKSVGTGACKNETLCRDAGRVSNLAGRPEPSKAKSNALQVPHRCDDASSRYVTPATSAQPSQWPSQRCQRTTEPQNHRTTEQVGISYNKYECPFLVSSTSSTTFSKTSSVDRASTTDSEPSSTRLDTPPCIGVSENSARTNGLCVGINHDKHGGPFRVPSTSSTMDSTTSSADRPSATDSEPSSARLNAPPCIGASEQSARTNNLHVGISSNKHGYPFLMSSTSLTTDSQTCSADRPSATDSEGEEPYTQLHAWRLVERARARRTLWRETCV